MTSHVAQRKTYYAGTACMTGAPPARPPGSWLNPIPVTSMPYTAQITVGAAPQPSRVAPRQRRSGACPLRLACCRS